MNVNMTAGAQHGYLDFAGGYSIGGVIGEQGSQSLDFNGGIGSEQTYSSELFGLDTAKNNEVSITGAGYSGAASQDISFGNQEIIGDKSNLSIGPDGIQGNYALSIGGETVRCDQCPDCPNCNCDLSTFTQIFNCCYPNIPMDCISTIGNTCDIDIGECVTAIGSCANGICQIACCIFNSFGDD